MSAPALRFPRRPHWQIAIATRDAADGALHAALLVRDLDDHAVLLRSR